MTDLLVNATVGCYAVIFTNKLKDNIGAKYQQAAKEMLELAKTQDGFLGLETARSADMFGISVSYWRDETAINNWKNNSEHVITQQIGKREFYQFFHLSVVKIERTYHWVASE